MKGILASEKLLKGFGVVKNVASKGCKYVIPIVEIILVSKSAKDTIDDLRLACGSVGYDDAVKAISNSSMYSGDKTKVLLALKRDGDTNFYRAIINTVKSSMYSSDKTTIILNMCGEHDE